MEKEKKSLFFSEKFIQGWLPAILAAVIIGLLRMLQLLHSSTIDTYSLTIAIIAGLTLFLVPALRDFLLLLIIYGVAFYAAMHVSELIKVAYDKGDEVKPSDWILVTQWVLIGLFAFASGLLESLNAPPSWGRRCYFWAIASYFLGSATMAYVKDGDWLNMIGRGVIGAVAIWGSIAFPYLNNEHNKQKALGAKEPPLVEELKPEVKVRRYE